MEDGHLDEFLRDIEERILDLRTQLEPLESGKIRTAEIRNDGQQIDTTDARILWLKKWITDYEALAAKVRWRGGLI
jgi:hypothetical protein